MILLCHTPQSVCRDAASARQRHRQLHRPGVDTGLAENGLQIPKLLHFIYLTGFEAFTSDTSKPDSRMPKKYFDTCQSVHQHWDSLFWNEEMGLQFLREHYPWFVPVWESFKGWGHVVSRMHH